MPRYYHTVDKNEARAPGPGIVELPDDNAFWSPLPPGHRLTYDGAGLPNGTELEPIPPPDPPTPEELIRIALHAAGVTIPALVIATALNERNPPISGPLTDLMTALDTVVAAHSTTPEAALDTL